MNGDTGEGYSTTPHLPCMCESCEFELVINSELGYLVQE